MKFDIDKDIDLHLPSPKNRNRCFVLFLGIFIGAGLLTLSLYNKNYLTFKPVRASQTQELFSDPAEQRELQSANLELGRLQSKFDELKNQLVIMDRENSILLVTNNELKRKLLRVEDELSDAKKKQLLYEDILAPDNLKQGLHVQYFGIRERETEENDAGGRYSYLLVLSHARSGKKIIQGQYSIRFYGKQDGKSKNYSHRELTADGIEANRKFSLKYYQSLEGEVVLPPGFEPEKVTLWILPKSKKYVNQSKNYLWKPLINQNKFTKG